MSDNRDGGFDSFLTVGKLEIFFTELLFSIILLH